MALFRYCDLPGHDGPRRHGAGRARREHLLGRGRPPAAGRRRRNEVAVMVVTTDSPVPRTWSRRSRLRRLPRRPRVSCRRVLRLRLASGSSAPSCPRGRSGAARPRSTSRALAGGSAPDPALRGGGRGARRVGCAGELLGPPGRASLASGVRRSSSSRGSGRLLLLEAAAEHLERKPLFPGACRVSASTSATSSRGTGPRRPSSVEITSPVPGSAGPGRTIVQSRLLAATRVGVALASGTAHRLRPGSGRGPDRGHDHEARDAEPPRRLDALDRGAEVDGRLRSAPIRARVGAIAADACPSVERGRVADQAARRMPRAQRADQARAYVRRRRRTAPAYVTCHPASHQRSDVLDRASDDVHPSSAAADDRR